MGIYEKLLEASGKLNDAALTKQLVIKMLIDEGYGTYAKRLKEYTFVVADVFHGCPIEVAAMFPDTGEIVINPSFLVDAPDGKIFKQLSLVVRHELLHFLLVHEKRFYDHLKKVDPEFEKTYRRASIHELANIAMDWELSQRGYDDYDKEVAHNLTLNGRVLGGLVLSMDRPEWIDKPMEEIFDLLRKEREDAIAEAEKLAEQEEIEVTIHRASHSPEYIDAYNKVIKKYDDEIYSDADLEALITELEADNDINID